MTGTINLNEQLKHYFGFDSFKGEQEAIIRNLLAGNDTFVLMPTGGGKSLCYQLPSLIMDGTAIVVSPLIALMKNQVDVINGLSEESGVAHYLNSSLNKAAINQVRNDIYAGRTKLVYGLRNRSIRRTISSFSARSRFRSTPSTRHTVYRNGVTTSVPNTATYALQYRK